MRLWITPLLVALILPAVVRADPPAGKPVCALLDPGKDPRAALLEAKLLADPGATWVERAGVEKVLAEQKLQALFSPQGVGERVRLGKLLKADLLVMVRSVKPDAGGGKAEPALEVVVCETAGGLRLLIRGVPVTPNAAADTDALAVVVRDGLKKYGEAVREVVAVPPFVSQDLEFTHDYLKAAYARLAEQAAVGRPGVVAVELAEAEALAKEIALAAPGSKLERPLPVYLLGEYRHEGKDKDRTVALKLRAERGGTPVGTPLAVTVKPVAAPAELQAWAAGILAAAGEKPAPPPDPKAEAKLLADRAREFQRLGNWAEAATLLDVAVLLDPDNFEARADILLPVTRMLTQLNARRVSRRVGGMTDPDPALVREFRTLQRRGLSHLEALYASDDMYRTIRARGIRGDDHRLLDALQQFNLSASRMWDGEAAARAEGREVLVRILVRLAREYPAQPPDQPIFREWLYFRVAFMTLPPKERYEAVEKLILQCQDFPAAQLRTKWYLVHAWELQNTARLNLLQEHAAFRALLDRLGGAGNADVRAAAAAERRRVDLLAKTPGAPGPAPLPGKLPLRPLLLNGEADGRPAEGLGGIQAAGPGVDVVWGTGALYLMTTKGQFRPVWTSPTGTARFASVCFDGRYAWAVLHEKDEWPALLVLDPAAGKVWRATGANDLPRGAGPAPQGPQIPRVKLAPLGHGRVCAVGSFGRTWVADVRFDPAAGKAAVKVIHEAREAQLAGRGEQPDRTTVSFRPDFALTLAGRPGGDGRVERRVIIGRGGPGRGPLVIDPDRETVTVLKAFSPGPVSPALPCWFAAADDAVYGVVITPRTGRSPAFDLVRMELPGLEWKVVGPARVAEPPLTNAAQATMIATAIHGGRLYYAVAVSNHPPRSGDSETRTRSHYEWWAVGLDGTGAQKLGADINNVSLSSSAFVSAHYGPVLDVVRDARPGLYTVEAADRPGK